MFNTDYTVSRPTIKENPVRLK
ncbi:hypothetical protein BDFB_011446 [Asbolus verrucosus]|uniref:Uncharacterized protein n=1 Tax=Asbolus verrucosus TaxID=1661398 RepID=A0A482VG96_ASBVE|nr:hypothetical protein BDFB_011446 [Asbolus verrucosus]